MPRSDPPKPGSLSSRRYARERVMQTLYAWIMTGDEFGFLEHELIENDPLLDETGMAFARTLAGAAREHRKECEAAIVARSANWDISRLAVIDRAILLMAVAELKYMRDVPPKVSIDEAIEIAKRFSTAESGGFVNGVLDAVLADLKSAGTLGKRGRGLRE